MALLTLGLLASTILAGCFGSQSNDFEEYSWAEIEYTGQCSPKILKAFTECTSASEDQPFHELNGFDLSYQDGSPDMGIFVMGIDEPIRISNGTVSGYPLGLVFDMRACENCDIEVKNVQISGGDDPEDSFARGFAGRNSAIVIHNDLNQDPIISVALQSIKITNAAVGIHITRAERINLANIVIDCQETGINVSGGDSTVSNITIEGCQGRAFKFDFDSVEFEDVFLKGNAVGMLGQEGYAKIKDSTFVNNKHHGAVFIGMDVDIYTSEVIGNGGGTWDSDYGCFNGGICKNSGSTWVIRNTLFEDNDGYGLYNAYFGTTLDARENWWGASTGPVIDLDGENKPGMILEGERITDNVDFMPFLEEPPS